MKFQKLVFCVAAACLFAGFFVPSSACADHQHTSGSEPVSISSAHLVAAGDWMLSYRFMHSEMSRHADSVIGEPIVDDHHAGMAMAQMERHLDDSPTSPISHEHRMRMEMHMLEGMYGVSDEFNAMVMVPFQAMDMTHLEHDEGFATNSHGIGDVSLSGLLNLYQQGHQQFLGGLGLSLPTGSIRGSDQYHAGESRHPYDMKLGSGTYDLLPTLTYRDGLGALGWGVQGNATIRLGENDADYRLGDRYVVNGWSSYQVSEWFTPSVRLSGVFIEDVHGRDEKITFTNAFGDPRQQASRTLELGIGAQFRIPSCGSKAAHTLGIEFVTPLAQTEDGGVHENDWAIWAGWSFHLPA